MKTFGETIRELRVAQDLGLRETAGKVGISPAYLSRTERGKESPPNPEIIKTLARNLAADPDVLFRLSSSTDPELTDYMHNQPEVLQLLRFLNKEKFDAKQLELLLERAIQIANSE